MILKDYILQRFTAKRPKGPSLFELRDAYDKNEAYACLEYPLELTVKYGDLIYLKGKQYWVTGPSGFQHVLKTNAKNYCKINAFYKRVQTVFGASILTTDGDFSKARRKIALPAFQSLFIKHYVPTMLRHTEDLIHSKTLASNKPINVLPLMNELTLKIAFQIFSNQMVSDKIIKTLGSAIHFSNWYVCHTFFVSKWFPSINNYKFHWKMHQLNRCLLDIIKKRRQSSEPQEDLLSLLLQAKDEDQKPFNNTAILNEFKTHLLTGHETTACALTWFFYLLAKHPEWQAKIQHELDTVLAGKTLSLENLGQLTLLNAAFLENLRLYPPIWSVPRKSIEADQIEGFDIPKKSSLFLNIYALHHHPKYWKNPFQFNPERFLGEGLNHQTPYTFLPFITGPRTCVAGNLATVEALLVAGTLLRHFRFETCTQTKVQFELCISLRPKNGIKLNIIPR